MGSHFLLQGIFPDPGMEPGSPALAGGLCIAGGFFTDRATEEAPLGTRHPERGRMWSPSSERQSLEKALAPISITVFPLLLMQLYLGLVVGIIPLCMSLWIQITPLMRTPVILGSTLITSFGLDYFCKDPIPNKVTVQSSGG